LHLPAPPVAGLILLLALKLGALFLFGPTMTPDRAGYIDYADQILTGDFLHVDLDASAFPMTLARPIGYTAIIAAAKFVVGARWAWAVVLFQFAMSVWATILVYRLAQRFGLRSWASLGVAAAQATAMQFVSTRRFYPTVCVRVRRRRRRVFWAPLSSCPSDLTRSGFSALALW
jgi:hypothetical protein